MGLDKVCIESDLGALAYADPWAYFPEMERRELPAAGRVGSLWGRAAESRRAAERGMRGSANGTPLTQGLLRLLPLPVGCNVGRMRDKNFSY